MLPRRSFLPLLASPLATRLRAQTQRPPNILLILFDKCTTAAISAYKEGPGRTPNLDALAAEGVRFANAYTPAALCGPARASILTGKYPHSHQLRRNVYPFDAGRLNSNYQEHIADPFRDPRFDLWDNFPYFLSNSGYATGLAGKWHLGPTNPGFFDYFKGFNSQLRHWVGEPHQSAWRPDIHTDDSIRFIERNASQPFFLETSYYAPHEPIDPPRPWLEKFQGVEHAAYNATVANLDWNVGRILNALRKSGAYDNTLVIFTADHGRTWIDRPGSAEGICLPYEEVSRVPLILRHPRLLPKGRTWRSGVTTADLMPTIMEASGIGLAQSATDSPRIPALQSRSLIAELRTGHDNWSRDIVLQNIPQRGIQDSYYDERALRTERHKLILRKFDVRPSLRPGELYDLTADPAESRNLYATQPATVKDLARRLATWGRTNKDPLATELGSWASSV